VITALEEKGEGFFTNLLIKVGQRYCSRIALTFFSGSKIEEASEDLR
jgi:hypothetical protein